MVEDEFPLDRYHAWAQALKITPREFVKSSLRYYDPRHLENPLSTSEEGFGRGK